MEEVITKGVKDWEQIIRDLERHGLTPYKIGLAIGIRARDVVRIRDHGRRVEYHEGEKLIALHNQLGQKWPTPPSLVMA